MTKTNEMSLEAFRLAVAEQFADLRTRALEAGVTKESIDELVSATYSQYGNYNLITNIRRIRSAIQNKIEAASADTLVGVIVGSHDRVGKNSPIKYVLVRKDKKHVEVSNFGTTAQYRDQKIEIPVPAMVTIKARYDSEFDSWNLISIEDYKILDKASLQKVLAQVVIPISSISKDMAYSQGHAPKPVVITGEISKVGTEAVFKYTENADGDRVASVDHYLPVIVARELAKDATDVLPCFNMSLRAKDRGANLVRCHISQQRHGAPTIMVTDLTEICEYAMKKFPNAPESQAEQLTTDLKELACVVVGTVATFKKTYSEDKSERNYVDITISALVEIEGTLDTGGAQKKLDQAPAAATPPITTQSPPVPGPVTASPPVAKANGSAKAPAPAKVLEIAKMLKYFCRAAGVKPDDISIDLLKKKALDIVDGVPDAVVSEAIAYVKESGV